MRVISCMIMLMLACTTFTGCSAFKKNTNGTSGTAAVGGGPAPAKFPQDPILNSNLTPSPQFPVSPTPPGPQSGVKGNSTILAGTVTDAYHRGLANAHIRLVSADPKDTATPPIDVAADARGHFIIQGVKVGQTYKLIARSKVGEKLVAGTLVTDAPNVRAMIMVREDLVNSSTPPIPGTPAYQAEPAQGQNNTSSEPNLPTTLTVPAAPVNAPVGKSPDPKPQNFVENPTDRLPMMKIPGKSTTPNAPIDPPRALPNAPEKSTLDTGATRVPSCVVVGHRVESVALKDTHGQIWDYKKQAQGKLLLLDFWYLQCLPCRESMPALNKLHQQYAARGLEVVGVAVPMDKSADERKEADAINKFCSAMQISYRQVLGRSGKVDAGKEFRVTAYPTMMLVSEQGDIFWHHVGLLEPNALNSLERIIQSRLK